MTRLQTSRIGWLDELEALEWAGDRGVPVVAGVVVNDRSDVPAAVGALGLPMVAKAVVGDGAHKAGIGAVRVDLDSVEAVEAAVDGLGPLAAAGQVLLQRQLRGTEAIVGIVRDPNLGPFVMVGVGGTLTEVVDDVAVWPAPLTQAEAESLIGSTRLGTVLGGEPGYAGLRDLSELLVSCGRIAAEDPTLLELDLNPVIVHTDGLTAVDARVRFGATTAGPERRPRDLSRLFEPATVAVVGASRDPSKPGGRALRHLRESGFSGTVIAVNSAGSVPGFDTVADVSELAGRSVDLACVAVPAVQVEEVLDDLGRCGVGSAIVFSDGVRSLEDGSEPGTTIAAMARRHGMDVVGPNSAGIACFGGGVTASMSMVFGLPRPEPGPIAVVSQSGAIASSLIGRGWDRGLRFSHWVSSGNEHDLGLHDYLNHLAQDPNAKAVLLFLETIRDGAAVAEALDRCRRSGTTVVACKVGRSEAAQRAARSHTGALAGHDRRYEAWLRANGVVRVGSYEALLDAAAALSRYRPVGGRRVGVITMSGGAAAVVADECARLGLLVPELGTETRTELRATVPGLTVVENPLDLGADAVLDPDVVAGCATRVAAAPGIDAVVVQLTTNADPAASRIAEGLVEVIEESDTPGAGFAHGIAPPGDRSNEDLRRRGRARVRHAGERGLGGRRVVRHRSPARHPVNFDLTEEQLQLARTARSLAVEEFATAEPPTGAMGREFVRSRARRLAELGFTGIDLPVADGGQGGELMDAVIVLREIARVCPHSGDVVQAYNFGGIRQIQALGSQYVKATWLKPALDGDILVSLAMSEPDAGSGLASIRTRARRDGDEIVIDGTKIFATHGVDADVVVVWCRFDEGGDGVGAVLVPSETAGFERGPTEHFMSGERYCEMSLDGCRLPSRNVLVERQGIRRLMPVFNVERLGNATRALALANRAFELAVEHAQTREVNGTLVRDLQGIRWKFADMRMRLDAAELLLHRAVVMDGGPSDEATAIAKCYANETAFYVADEALQVHGAYGYSASSPLEYIFRRTRGWRIAGGTTEILRNRIARHVLGRSPS